MASRFPCVTVFSPGRFPRPPGCWKDLHAFRLSQNGYGVHVKLHRLQHYLSEHCKRCVHLVLLQILVVPFTLLLTLCCFCSALSVLCFAFCILRCPADVFVVAFCIVLLMFFFSDHSHRRLRTEPFRRLRRTNLFERTGLEKKGLLTQSL